MNNIFSKNYIQKAIKEQIKASKIYALHAYIRKLIPRYNLTNELKNKISKLVDEEK